MQVAALVSLITAAIFCAPNETFAQSSPEQSSPDELVELLADDDPAVRQHAQAQLEQLGIGAFEALYRARNSGDLEQQLAVQKLLRQTRIEWPEDLSFELRQIVLQFESGRSSHQRVCLELIRRHQNHGAAEVLGLITRYEMDETISRFAALNLIRFLDECEQTDVRRRISESFLVSTAGLQRDGVDWVRTRILDHENTSDFTRSWITTLDSVVDELETQPPGVDHYDERLIAMRLSLWVSRELAQRNQSQLAGRVIDRIAVHTDPEWLSEILLLTRHYRMLEQARRLTSLHEPDLDEDPLPLFHLARIEQECGDPDSAVDLVLRAMKLADTYSGTALETAVELQHFGYHDWSCQLLQSVIDRDKTAPVTSARSSLILADLYYSNEQYESAALAMAPLAAALDSDTDLANSIQKHIGITRQTIESRFFLYRALAAREQGNHGEYAEMLICGLTQDSTQSDLLIQAHRCVFFEPERAQLIARLVQTRLSQLRAELDDFESQRIGPGNVRLRKNQNRNYARLANSYAWLLVNTGGDPAEALESARLANSLAPDTAAYLDTEARCRFVAGDEDGAIRYQRIACQIEPASRELKQQLGVYRRYRAATRDTPLAGTITR
ncbi:MAG: hypothetical protein AAF456_05525 [Planctomycetota bacterium]